MVMALGLTACVDDEYRGGDTTPGDGAVSFNNTVAPFTRAGKTGKEAADALGGKFYVYGIKNETTVGPGILSSENLVFNNYKVTYTDGSANTSTSNSTGWEYVGNTLTTGETANIDNSGTGTQTIKYWDYNASSYTFYAFAVANDDLENGKIKVKKVTDVPLDAYLNGYEMTVTADADPTQLYLSKRVEIMASANKDKTQVNEYGGRVNMEFRNAMAKVRVGMYETIPGYTLTIDAFRIADNAAPTFGDMTTVKTDGFAANIANNKSGKAGTMTVIYKDENTTEVNVPAVLFDATHDNVLTLGNNLCQGKQLGDKATGLVYDTDGGGYTYVYPMEGNGSNMKLKVDFTLHSTVGETIEVKNATAEVPAAYLKWRPGYAYTYIFKISDQTNATIGSLTGLYPITFDAVAINDGTGQEEEISTTGTEVNIVTMGYDPTTKMITVGQDDYNNGNTVYASFIANNSLVAPASSNTRLYIVTTDDSDTYPITEANVSGYLEAYRLDNTLLDQPVTVYEQTIPSEAFVSEVPVGNGTTDMRTLSAVSWTAGNHVYAVEYTNTAGTKYYKIVHVDGYGGRTVGTLSLSDNDITNMGASVTPTLTVDGVTPSNADVTYSLDYAGSYGQAVPATVTIENDGTTGVKVNIQAGTDPTTGSKKYTVIATYNRRTYKAKFTVSQ